MTLDSHQQAAGISALLGHSCAPPPPILLLVTTAALFLVLAYLPTLRYLMLGQLDQVQQGNVLEGTHFLLRQRLPCLSREAFEHLGGNQYGGGFS